MDIKTGGVRRSIDLLQVYRRNLGEGLVATDGVVYTPVATFASPAGATEILNELINPGFHMSLKQIQVGLTQKFIELVGGTTTSSMSYYWDMREENYGSLHSWIAISATYAKGIGSKASSEDTLSGYVPVATFPVAPIRIRLQAAGLVPSSMTGAIKCSSFIEITGIVIPGA